MNNNKKQVISIFSDHLRISSFQDNRHIQSSLEQSPIAKQQSMQQDHSPQHLFYPSSLEPKQKRNIKNLNLKNDIVSLLYKLKDWLLQLCLTESCSHQIIEQLEPIIYEIKDARHESSYYSNSIDNSSSINQKIMSKSFIFRYNKNYLQDSNYQQSNYQHYHQEQSIVLLTLEQKELLKLFFKNYHRLLSNNLQRISKYSGQKKLKFLISTIMRNIFSQTLRLSYDLKLLQHKIHEQKQQTYKKNKKSYLIILKDRLSMLFSQKGHIKDTFNIMKYIYYDRYMKDQVIVYGMIDKINKLVNIFEKNKKSILFKYTLNWRQSINQMKVKTQITIIQKIRSKLQKIISCLFFFENDKDTFSFYWKDSIEHYLNQLISETFQGQDCLFVSMQEILKQKYFKKQKEISVIEYLTQYEKSTERQYSFKDHLFLNQFTLEQLKNCILSGQIYRNDRSANNVLLVPIKAAPGIIFVRLSTESQNSFQSNQRRPMTLNSFRILLRVVQLISPLLQNLVTICKKIQKDWQQVQQNSHFQLLFKEYLKSNILSQQPSSQKQQYLIQNNEQALQIYSHRLQQTSQTIKTILTKYNINCLMVYHYKSSSNVSTITTTINQSPCILYGDKEVPLTIKHIVQSIYNQLLGSGKEYLVIVRNQKCFNILPIKSQGKIIGFINYTTLVQCKMDNQLLQECLVPLILRSQGSINCQQCKISLKIHKMVSNTSITQPYHLLLETQSSNHIFSSLINIASSISLLDLQQNCKTILRSKGEFFFKVIYKINLNSNHQYFSIEQEDKKIEFLKIEQNQRLNHHQGFIELYQTLTNCSAYAKLVFKNPTFPNPQLHIFQYQNLCTFKLQALPIKISKDHYGYILIGYYLTQNINKDDITTFIKKISIGVNSNQNIFKINSLQKSFQLCERSKVEGSFINLMKMKNGISMKGKLIEDFRMFSRNLQKISHELWQDNRLNVKIFKLNTQTKALYPLNKQSKVERSFYVKKELMELFNNSIFHTHERIFAGECNFSQKHFSSTIKPSKINNLFNNSIFYPKINEAANKQLKQHIKNRYKLQAWIANQNLQKIEEMYLSLYGKFFNENTYFIMNIGKKQDKNVQYIAILQWKIDQQNHKSSINQNLLLEIQQAYLALFKKHIFLTQNSIKKKQSIHNLQMILRNGLTNQKAVKQFYLNFVKIQENVKIMGDKLSLVLCHHANKNKKYFMMIKTGFQYLKSFNYQKLNKNNLFLTRVLPIISQYEIKCDKIGFFNEFYKKTEQSRAIFRQKRSIQLIQSLMNKLISSIYTKSILLIKSHNELTSYNKNISKHLSITKLTNTLKFLTNKQYHHLFQQFTKYHHIFSYYFKLITEEYQNIKFQKRQSFLRYSNQRFNNIISHINFGILKKIDIMTCLIIDNKMIIHKIGEINEFQTCSVEYDVNNPIDRYQGFQMILVQENNNRKHYVMYKLNSKFQQYSQKQSLIVHQTILNSIKPCYLEYLKKISEKVEKMSKILLNIACKEVWNGSAGNAQGIYAFGGNLCLQHQCDKLKAINIIKTMKMCTNIKGLKSLRQSINQQSKINYKLEYQHNALTNALSSGITNEILQEQSQIFNKYGQLITKIKLKQMRQETQRFENLEQKMNLQYQIKSKTFSTLKSIVFCDKKQTQVRQGLIVDYLTNNKQNINQKQKQNRLQKLYVEKRIQLKSIKDNINFEKKMVKTKTSRALWLILSKILKTLQCRDKKQVLSKLMYPRNKVVHRRF